jgi:hypothetical protein
VVENRSHATKLPGSEHPMPSRRARQRLQTALEAELLFACVHVRLRHGVDSQAPRRRPEHRVQLRSQLQSREAVRRGAQISPEREEAIERQHLRPHHGFGADLVVLEGCEGGDEVHGRSGSEIEASDVGHAARIALAMARTDSSEQKANDDKIEQHFGAATRAAIEGEGEGDERRQEARARARDDNVTSSAGPRRSAENACFVVPMHGTLSG